jgi:signal transduction histidine kinase
MTTTAPSTRGSRVSGRGHYSTAGLSRAGPGQLRGMRLLRVGILGPGLAAGLVIEVGANAGQLDLRFLAGVTLAVIVTLATFAPGFAAFSRWSLALIAVFDFFTLLLVFDLQASHEVVDAVVAVPAMWLGIVLGRKGVLLAVSLSVALFIAPGLFLYGSPVGGWEHGTAVAVFALLASAGLAASAEMWDGQLHRLEETGVELNKAIDRLEETGVELNRAMDVKDDFISLVSHELRTPLTSIIGYLDLAIDEAEAIPGPINGHLSAVSRNADRLLVLVTDLLGAEQAEREPMVLIRKPTNLSSLVQVSIDDFAFRAEAAGVELISEIEPHISISADPGRVLQAIDNLVSNAVKYTPPAGRVTLTLRRHEDRVLLEVSDTGIGIGAADQPGLFTKFFRARNATELAIQGIGLGLMITKIIVEAHGGTIAFESQEGVGTSMRVVLPVKHPVAEIHDLPAA